LPESDLLLFAVRPSRVQGRLLLLDQVDQCEYEGELPVDSMTWSEEFVKFKRRRVAKQALKHGENVLHELIVTSRGQLKSLFGDIVCKATGVEQDDEVDRRQEDARIAC
jgi:hypothetical protein